MPSDVEMGSPLRIRAPRGPSLALIANTALAVLGAGLAYYLYYFHPVAYVAFVSEDSWVEWATVVSFLLAFCLLVWTLCTQKASRRPGLFLLAVATLFVAMEEIDWGQRLLGFQSPQFFADHNLNQATTVHNLFDLKYRVVGLIVFVCCILLPFLAMRSIRVSESCRRLGIPLVPIHLWPFFIAAIYLMYSSIAKRTELAEAYLGIGIAAVALDLALTAKQGAGAGGVHAVFVTSGMVVIIGILTALLVHVSPWPEEFARSLHRFAVARYPARGMLRQAEMLFDYMNRRPQFLNANTRFFHGEVLMRLGRHAEGRTVLETALSEQQERQRRDPDDPEPHRMTGQILALLDQPEKAQSALLTALEKDAARLQKAADDRATSSAHRSRALTLLALGDREAARMELSRAYALASDSRSRRGLRRLIKSSLSGGTVRHGAVD